MKASRLASVSTEFGWISCTGVLVSTKRAGDLYQNRRVEPVQHHQDYCRLFDHVSRLRKVVILTSPRAGSDFFHSLLDDHSQILQMPGQFQFYAFWANALCKEDLPDLVQEFTWDRRHLPKFNSRHDQAERWHMLGEARDEHFEVDSRVFAAHMEKLMKGRALTSANFYTAVHAAYCLAKGQPEILETKVWLCHIHEPYSLPPFHKDFPDYDVVYCTRDPRNALVSTVENIMLPYGQMDLGFFRFWLRWIVRDAEQVLPFTSRVKALPLERLHERSELVLREFCGEFGLQFEPCLLESTWAGKRWWGDSRSKAFLGGFRREIQRPRWQGKLTWMDVAALEFVLAPRLRQYGYPMASGAGYRRLAPFVLGWPMRYEWELAWLSVRRERSPLRKALAALQSLCEYAARIRFFYGLWWSGRKHPPFVAAVYGAEAIDPALDLQPSVKLQSASLPKYGPA